MKTFFATLIKVLAAATVAGVFAFGFYLEGRQDGRLSGYQDNTDSVLIEVIKKHITEEPRYLVSYVYHTTTEGWHAGYGYMMYEHPIDDLNFVRFAAFENEAALRFELGVPPTKIKSLSILSINKL